jgi:transposase
MLKLSFNARLVAGIDHDLHLLKRHLPYDETDHVLNIAFNILAGGRRVEHLERLRNHAVYLDALGAVRTPDPTTAGDFCRRSVTPIENRGAVPVEIRSAHGFTRDILYKLDEFVRLCSPVSRGRAVYNNMHVWAKIRRRVLVERLSKRTACREFDLHWSTLEKILACDEPPGYRAAGPRVKPKLGPFLSVIHQILETDRSAPPKQRHTAARIYHRLRSEFGYRGGLSVVRDAVRAWRRRQAQVFVPIAHGPEEAQADFGRAELVLAGQPVKAALFVMTVPVSGALFRCVFPRECTESCLEGHIRAFTFFGGVPRRISYDNTRIAVFKIIQRRGDALTEAFERLKSYYLFDSHFCLVRRPNEKGHVENLVGYARRDFLVPVPVADDFPSLNDVLTQRYREDLTRRAWGQTATNAERLAGQLPAFLPVLATPFDPSRVVSSRVNSLSLVQFDTNNYSVPVRHAHQRVTLRAGIETVCIECDGQLNAEHRREWGQSQMVFHWVHYLRLLEHKPGAPDYARPLLGVTLPDCFAVLRRRWEEADPANGTVEFIRVLMLHEDFSSEEPTSAVQAALLLPTIKAADVRVLLERTREDPADPLSLESRPHLKAIRVGRPDLKGYCELLAGGEAQP